MRLPPPFAPWAKRAGARSRNLGASPGWREAAVRRAPPHNFVRKAARRAANHSVQQHSSPLGPPNCQAAGYTQWVTPERRPRTADRMAPLGRLSALTSPAMRTLIFLLSVACVLVVSADPTAPAASGSPIHVCWVIRTYWRHGPSAEGSLPRLLKSLNKQSVSRYASGLSFRRLPCNTLTSRDVRPTAVQATRRGEHALRPRPLYCGLQNGTFFLGRRTQSP